MSLFITLEGPEGSGKSTVAKMVVAKLEAEGYKIVMTREPGGTPISEQIRDVILRKENTAMDSITEAMLYAASRRQHLVEKIYPALKEGKLVFCDRYLDSSLAYQGYARGNDVEEILAINKFATGGNFPDLTLLFDIDPELGLKRIASNKGREVNRLDLESLPFHHRVRDGYLTLAKKYPSRYVIIDASMPLENVVEVTYNVIKERLKDK